MGTKSQTASEKSLPARGRNISSSNRVAKSRDGLSDFLSNLMEPSHPYLLPRTVPTSAGVIYQKPQMTLTKDLDTEAYGLAVIRPNVEKMIRYSKNYSSEPVSSVNLRTPNEDKANVPGLLSLSAPIYLADGSKIRGEVVPSNWNVIEPDGSITSGNYVFPKMTWTDSSRLDIQLKTDLSEGTLSTLSISLESGSVLKSTVLTSAYGIFTYAWTPSAGGTDSLVVKMNNIVSENVSIVMKFTGFDAVAGTTYKTRSLWKLLGDVHGSEACKDQFYGSQKYAITGFSLLMRNTTASQYKSGSVVCAQLPGGSSHLIPNDPEKAYRFISSYNDPKTYSGPLNDGVHWFFTPEKVQDWFYRPTTDLEGDRPVLAIAWSGVSANSLANMLGLTFEFRVNIELLTTDVSLMKFMPSSDLGRLMELYITLVNAHNTLGENPGHLEKIRKITRDIVNNPYVREGARAMVRAGKVILPLALAAL